MKKQRKFEFGNELVTALSMIVIGLMFMIYKGEIITLAMSIIGVVLLVLGIIDLVRGFVVSGVAKTVFGALVLVAGWAFVTLALYILGACLLVAGILQLVAMQKVNVKKVTLGYITHILQPIVYILVAACLFFNQGGAISWVFTVSGLFLILDGVIALIGALDEK